SVPASPQFLSAARVVAASLGVEAGLDVDDLDDLRLGVNELVSLLVEVAAPGSRVDLEFEVDDVRITVRGAIDEAVVDHHEVDGSSFSLSKAASLRGNS